MARYFPSAPWPTALKIISLLGTVALIGASCAAYSAIPVVPGFTHNFGLAVALVPLGLLVGSSLFVVTGYRVDRKQLAVRRLLTSTLVPLTGLERAWLEPAICKGSIRLVGNGGLYSFCGWFYSKRLGRYRLFATDLRNAVALQLPNRTVAISPANPDALVDYLRQLFPILETTPLEGCRAAQDVRGAAR
jgi:hypothetical protein